MDQRRRATIAWTTAAVAVALIVPPARADRALRERNEHQLPRALPPHEAGVTCSFWEISDRPRRVARICLDEDGELVQKLERGPGEEPAGSAV